MSWSVQAGMQAWVTRIRGITRQPERFRGNRVGMKWMRMPRGREVAVVVVVVGDCRSVMRIHSRGGVGVYEGDMMGVGMGSMSISISIDVGVLLGIGIGGVVGA